MNYKMIAIDLDGTLLDDERKIPKENLKTLKNLHHKGISIVIATGRSYLFAKQAIENIGVPVALISNNGNALWEPQHDKELAVKYIDPETFYNVAREGRERDLFPILHVAHFDQGIDFIVEHSPDSKPYGTYLSQSLDRLHIMKDLDSYMEPRVMMMCYTGDLNRLKEFQDVIQSKFPQTLYSHIVLTLTSIGPMLEISHPQGTKWHMVEEYGQSLGIESHEIIAIGNDTNDITMLTNSGMGVAVANSTDDVKKAASLVSPYTNNQAGVAKVLQQLFSF